MVQYQVVINSHFLPLKLEPLYEAPLINILFWKWRVAPIMFLIQVVPTLKQMQCLLFIFLLGFFVQLTNGCISSKVMSVYSCTVDRTPWTPNLPIQVWHFTVYIDQHGPSTVNNNSSYKVFLLWELFCSLWQTSLLSAVVRGGLLNWSCGTS